jgi:hypothetical protein
MRGRVRSHGISFALASSALACGASQNDALVVAPLESSARPTASAATSATPVDSSKPPHRPPARRTVDADEPPMSVPGPLAMPCSDDSACGTHRCNVAYAKCTFPCQSQGDCAVGTACTMGLCVPVP